MAQVRLKVNAVDLTANLLDPPDGDWEIEQQAFGAMANASFILHDPSNTITLTAGKEVIFEKFSDSNVRYFGGFLTEATETTWGLGRRFACRALGWQFELSRTVVNQIFNAKSDQHVITDATDGIFLGLNSAVQKDLSSYTVTTANVGLAIPDLQKFVINGDTITQIMDTLAKLANWVWGVTPDKTVYYRDYAALANSQALSDAPDESTSFHYTALSRFRNLAEIVNAVYVYGGRFTNEDQTRTYSADGNQTDFIVPHDWRSKDDEATHKVTVEKNTGTDPSPVWTAQTVGTPQEEGSFDVVWHELGRSFIFASAPANLTSSWRVNGNIYDTLYWDEFDDDSIAEHGQFEITIRDATLRDQNAVERRALAELRKRSGEGERITCRTTQDDFEVGKTVTFTNSILGISAVDYLIDRMVMRPLGGTVSEYELTLRKVPS